MAMSVIHFRHAEASAINHLLASPQFLNYCMVNQAKVHFDDREHSINVPDTYMRVGLLFETLPERDPNDFYLMAHVPFIKQWLHQFPVSTEGVQVVHGQHLDYQQLSGGKPTLAMEWVAIHSHEEVILIAQTLPTYTVMVGYCTTGERGDIYTEFFNERWGSERVPSKGLPAKDET